MRAGRAIAPEVVVGWDLRFTKLGLGLAARVGSALDRRAAYEVKERWVGFDLRFDALFDLSPIALVIGGGPAARVVSQDLLANNAEQLRRAGYEDSLSATALALGGTGRAAIEVPLVGSSWLSAEAGATALVNRGESGLAARLSIGGAVMIGWEL